MRRAAALGLSLGLGLLALPAVLDAPARPPAGGALYLPRVEQRGPAPAPARPASPAELLGAIEAGGRVLPRPGVYELPRQAKAGPGLALDGGGQVEITGHGILIEDMVGVRIEALTIRDCSGDAITVERSTGVLLRQLRLASCTDGLLDVVHGPSGVRVEGGLIGPDDKCSLVGHQWDGLDAGTSVEFRRVTFSRCDKRTPKVHRAQVTVEGGEVIAWKQREAVDVQLGGLVILKGVTFTPGPKSHLPPWVTSTGGRVLIEE